MASCPSPPKKRPKLSLKFIKKDKPPSTDGGEHEPSSDSLKNGSGRVGHNGTPDCHSSTTSSATSSTQELLTQESQLSTCTVHSTPPPPYAGLQNLGNTCYLNSVLQALRYCPGFCQGLCQLTSMWEEIRAELKAKGEDGDFDRKRCGREMKIVVNLKKLYDKMSAKEADFIACPSVDTTLSISPDEVLETVRELNPMFQGFLQHDSQELLCCLLSYVTDPCQSLKNQLDKLHPQSSKCAEKSESASKCEPVSKNETCTASDDLNSSINNGKIAASSNTDVSVESSNVNEESCNQKDHVVNANGDGQPRTGKSKKNPKQQSLSTSSESTVGAKAETSPVVNGDLHKPFVNGSGDHFPTSCDQGQQKIPKRDNSDTCVANGSGPQEQPCKKKRLGKFRVPSNQSSLLNLFPPLKKDLEAPNGVRKEFLVNSHDAPVNGADIDSKMRNGDGVVSNQLCETKSEMEFNACHAKNGQNDSRLESTLSKPHVEKILSPSLITTEPVNGLHDVNKASGLQVCSTATRELEMICGLFQGALLLRTRCNECESYTERREQFQDISLPVRNMTMSLGGGEKEGKPEVSPADLSLGWAISEFACVERLTDDNKYFCEHCRHHAEAERSMLFGELPPVLTFHLKRFSAFAGFLSADSTVSKVNDHLATPLSLQLSQWCAKQCKQLQCTYDLCAVVMHSGVSSSSGHYVSYVQIPNRSVHSDDKGQHSKNDEPQWGQFDDDRVSLLTQQEMTSSVLHPVSSSSNAATPYLLFYRQVQESD